MQWNDQRNWGRWLALFVVLAAGLFVMFRFVGQNAALELRMAANAGDLQRAQRLLQTRPGIINACETRWLGAGATSWTNAPQGHLFAKRLLSKYMLNEARSLLDTNSEITSKGPVLTCSFELQEVNGATALHQAVYGRHFDMVELLCQNGANPNIQDRSGATPLMAAVWTEQDRMVETLLAAGAMQLPDHSGVSPLEHARLRKNQKIIGMLLVASTNGVANQRSGRGQE